MSRIGFCLSQMGTYLSYKAGPLSAKNDIRAVIIFSGKFVNFSLTTHRGADFGPPDGKTLL
jgi:hypothetical protein